MSATPDLLNLFTEPAVALIYFLSVILLSQAALFMALGQRLRGPREKGATRYAAASAGVMFAWLVMMVGAIVSLLTGTPAELILPPLDRAVSALVIVLVGWAFLTADQFTDQPHVPRRIPNVLSIVSLLAGLAVIAGYVYTAIQWYNGAARDFNLSPYGLYWSVAISALAALGLLLLIVRFRLAVDAPLKMIFFAFVLVGSVYTLINTYNGTLIGSDAGALRLAFLAAMPFLPIVVYRFVIDRLMGAYESKAAQVALQAAIPATGPLPGIDQTSEREAPTLLKALGLMIERDVPDALPQQIVTSAATVLKADVTALLVLDDAEYADVIAAYDNIQQKSIAAMALKLNEQPTLQRCIEDHEQHALTTERNLNEMVDLYTRLDIQKIGPAYFQPLLRDGNVTAVFMVGLPYTQRELRPNELNLLQALAPIAARLLGISRAAQQARLESDDRAVQAVVEGENIEIPPSSPRTEMQASLEVARQQINELSTRVRDLQIELDYERGRIAEMSASDPEGLSITQRMARMSAERTQLEAEREKLMQALEEAQTRLATASGDEDELYSTIIRTLQKERDDLHAQKEQLEAQLVEIRSMGQVQAPTVLRDMLTNLSDERARLTVERDTIRGQLGEVETQLQALGIEGGPGGLTTMFIQLTEDRSKYKALAEKAIQDRDTLLNERKRIAKLIATEQQRAAKIAAMESELRRLAEDREALLQQRNSLRNERQITNTDREKWEEQRAKMVAEMASIESDLEEAIFERNRITNERSKLAQEHTSVQAERDKLLAHVTTLQTERDQLMARIEGNREELQRLGADGVGALKTMIDDLTEERSELEHKLLRLQSELNSAKEAVSRSQAQLVKATSGPSLISATAAEVMLSIAQELRTPMSSITGYVDLLLGESVGILGALQRQFLQRVKANVDRLGTLLEDFIHVTAIDTGQMTLEPQDVDVIGVIDDAITATRTQFREKGITLKMDLPDSLPPLHGDRDAVQQIVIQLLSNAYLASPTDGEVGIQAKLEKAYSLQDRGSGAETKTDVIFLSVRDMGGGIPQEEQNRVFSRLYRADNPLIQGLGDTGVGLSIARALTEVHGGRIWMESKIGEGSTFKLVIPLAGAMRPERLERATS